MKITQPELLDDFYVIRVGGRYYYTDKGLETYNLWEAEQWLSFSLAQDFNQAEHLDGSIRHIRVTAEIVS